MLVCNQFVVRVHLQAPNILLHDTQAHMSVFHQHGYVSRPTGTWYISNLAR